MICKLMDLVNSRLPPNLHIKLEPFIVYGYFEYTIKSSTVPPTCLDTGNLP